MASNQNVTMNPTAGLQSSYGRVFDGFEQERRGLFDGLSVPHSIKATVIAALGLLVYYLGVRGIEEGFGVPGTTDCRLIAGMLGNLSARAGGFGAWLAHQGGWANEVSAYSIGVWAAFWVFSAAVWAFFAGAICRIAAIKLAREEVIEIGEALRFGLAKFLPNFLSIVFVLGFAGFFLLFCNATLAGWLGRIPYLGDILLGLFFPLVLLSTLLAVFVSALGLIGFNLAAAAIATEASDTFDGVSRAWNYVLARPWQVILTLFAICAYLSLVLFFGQAFLRFSVKSLTVGEWGLGAAPRVLEVDDEQRKDLDLPASIQYVLVPGKGDYLYGRLIDKRYRPRELSGGKTSIEFKQGLEYALERYREHTGSYPPSLGALVVRPAGAELDAWHGPYLDVAELPVDRWGQPFVYQRTPNGAHPFEIRSPGYDKQLGTNDDPKLVDLERELGPKGPALNVAPVLEPTLAFEVGLMRMWIGIARLLLFGYVVAYFLSAQTMVYFLLRKDVEGDDYTEVTLEDELDDFEEDLSIVGGPVDKKPASPGKKPLPTATPAADSTAAEEKAAEEKPAEEKPAEGDADAEQPAEGDADASEGDADASEGEDAAGEEKKD